VEFKRGRFSRLTYFLFDYRRLFIVHGPVGLGNGSQTVVRQRRPYDRRFRKGSYQAVGFWNVLGKRFFRYTRPINALRRSIRDASSTRYFNHRACHFEYRIVSVARSSSINGFKSIRIYKLTRKQYAIIVYLFVAINFRSYIRTIYIYIISSEK